MQNKIYFIFLPIYITQGLKKSVSNPLSPNNTRNKGLSINSIPQSIFNKKYFNPFFSSAEGKIFEELEKIDGDIYAHPFSKNQESLGQLLERTSIAIKFLLNDAKERGYKSVGIAGHGDPLCALNWSIKHKDPPSAYHEMKNEFYPQKGQAYIYTISNDESFRATDEGRIITTEAKVQTI